MNSIFNEIRYSCPKVVAEIGCNHMGDINIAKELINLAKECKADFVKFQKRNNRELLSKEKYNAPHPNPMHSYGKTYGEHREFLEFTIEQHFELYEYCKQIDIGYATSVWDVSSTKEIVQLNPDYIKVPSASNNNMKLLQVLKDEYDGDIHISLGMTTAEEEKKIVDFFKDNKTNNRRLILYACTSGYPVPFEDVNLLELVRIISCYKDSISQYGFSGHHLGIAIDNAAFTLGATWIERHFTKDRTWKGTDHAASLEPTGLKKLIRDLNATYQSLQFKEKEIIDIEKPQREKLKYTQNE